MDRMDEGDAVVVAQVCAGDSGAFRVLVDRHSRAVFRLAYRLTGNQQDAEDVVQETFLRAYRQLKRFESRASFRTWIHRIAANCAVDLLRQRPRPQAAAALGHPDTAGAADPPDENAIGPDRWAEGAEIRMKMRRALDELTPAERTAFVMRHFEGRSLTEIGQALGLRTGATKHSIFRAVQKMRRALEPLVTL
jgi:RNA polymerase sigma-70 factor (ECF subfamily)